MFKAVESFTHAGFPSIVVTQGDVFVDDDPVVLAHPKLFAKAKPKKETE